MPTITLKDENGKPIIDSLTGKLVQENVSMEVAMFLKKNNSNMKRLENIDDRHFGLLHFEDQAWNNMQELSVRYGPEDLCLGILLEIAASERVHYLKRLTRCRRAYQVLRKACTPTQWRRLILNRFAGKTTREIAKAEHRSFVSIAESIMSAEKKIRKILADLL